MKQAIIDIVEVLISKSENKNALWTKTSGNDEYKIVLGSGNAVTIDSWFQNHESTLDISIYNKDGNIILNHSCDSNNQHYVLLQKLHNNAKDTYYKVDDVLTDILGEIHSNEQIGEDPDDLPF